MRALALSLCLAAPSAHALGAGDPEGLLKAIQDLGYPAVLQEDEVGNPVIAPNSETAAFPWVIFFDWCQDGPCRDLSFISWSEVTNISKDYANNWNSYDPVARMFIQPDGTPRVQMRVVEARNITPEQLQAMIERFEGAVYGMFVAAEGL